MSQSRNWVFTRQATQAEAAGWNNTAAAAIPEPFAWHTDARIKFVKYQIERAPTTGQLHIQGMISFKGNTKMSTVTNLLGNNPHLEVCKDVKASYDYCGRSEEHTSELQSP